MFDNFIIVINTGFTVNEENRKLFFEFSKEVYGLLELKEATVYQGNMIQIRNKIKEIDEIKKVIEFSKNYFKELTLFFNRVQNNGIILLEIFIKVEDIDFDKIK